MPYRAEASRRQGREVTYTGAVSNEPQTTNKFNWGKAAKITGIVLAIALALGAMSAGLRFHSQIKDGWHAKGMGHFFGKKFKFMNGLNNGACTGTLAGIITLATLGLVSSGALVCRAYRSCKTDSSTQPYYLPDT